MTRPSVGLARAVTRIISNDLVRSESFLSMRFLSRLFYFCVLGRKLRTLNSELAFPVTLQHNLKSLTRKLNRMQLLIRPLSVLEHVDKRARILVIGPRNEWDLFLLHRHGFEFEQCTGLDLISYSPKVNLGDMHGMSYADEEFDVVLCGWTLSYSAEPGAACREMARVCKKRGTIGIGVEYFTGTEEDERRGTGGYVIKDSRLAERINSVEQILAFFPGRGSVYFSHDAPAKRGVSSELPPSNSAVIFENG